MIETNPFSPFFLKKLQTCLEETIEKVPKPHYAAFDADGTLWKEGYW